MGFLRRLFGGSDQPASDDAGGESAEAGEDQRPAVTAWLRLSDPEFESSREQMRVFDLENRIIGVVDASGLGVYDTNELAGGAFGMRVLGNDPDAILGLLRPLLIDAPTGSYLTVRRGGSGTSEERVEIRES